MKNIDKLSRLATSIDDLNKKKHQLESMFIYSDIKIAFYNWLGSPAVHFMVKVGGDYQVAARADINDGVATVTPIISIADGAVLRGLEKAINEWLHLDVTRKKPKHPPTNGSIRVDLIMPSVALESDTALLDVVTVDASYNYYGGTSWEINSASELDNDQEEIEITSCIDSFTFCNVDITSGQEAEIERLALELVKSGNE